MDELSLEKLKKVYAVYPTRGLKCEGCNLGKDYYSDGYRCIRSGFFFHKECAYSSRKVDNLYHPQHMLKLKIASEIEDVNGECKICRGNLPKMYYYCSRCDFALDLKCARKHVMVKIEGPKTHEHPLYLIPKLIMFTCYICELPDDRFPYACNICDLSFHKDCAESTPELEYSCHPIHPLKRLTRTPRYTNGKCCLCGGKLYRVFYHCSICNFSVDVNCAKNPPLFTLVEPKAHQHPLTLLPQRTFVCNVCGIDDDPNTYVCLHCNFMVHRNCIDIPGIIKINRHAHRLCYNHCLTAGEWNCGVCQKEIKWTCGAYLCSRCPAFAIHIRCGTRFGIWDGISLEGILEDNSDYKSYEMIEEAVIKHFSHEEHILKLQEGSDANDQCLWCEACTYPILSSPFYHCMECDDFIIHEKCAYLPKKITDSFYKLSMILVSDPTCTYLCEACQNYFQGLAYTNVVDQSMYRSSYVVFLDVRCGSISEPFVHESHPLHSLYISYSMGDKFCNACGDKSTMVLTCEECGFVLDIKCSILPKMVKHKNDKDHFLSLCYGGKASEYYWCEICEEDLNPEKWFYSCDHCGITFHIKCTFGDFIWIKPKGEGAAFFFNLIPNNRNSRPICYACNCRCQFPFTLKLHGYEFCSLRCLNINVCNILGQGS